MILRTILVLGTVLLLGAASAQETRVLNGRKFTVHTVQAGQTLYAIGRHYAVPVEAIQRANPAAASGLSVGQVLLIPQDAVVKKEVKNAPALFAGELAHTVRKKETLYGIARMYGVDQVELVKRNPEIAVGMKEGMVVIVPVNKVSGVSENQTRPAAADGSTLHEVAQGETLFSLGQRYGVEAEAIKAANGGLPEGLKAGAQVRIPVARPVVVTTSIMADSLSLRQRYDIALMLPFSIDRNDSVLALAEAKGYYSYTGIATQFYAGARMAIDSLERTGLNADVRVFDMGTDPQVWSAVLKRPEVRDVDLFLGPFHRTAIEELSRVNKHAHIVCPVQQSNKVLLGHPNVSKVVNARADQVQQLARHCAAHHALDNIVLCRPDLPAEKELQEQMARALQDALMAQPSRLPDSVVVARPGKRDITDLVERLDAARMNVVVVPSEDVESVTNIVGKLAPIAGRYRITVYGLNSWLDMGSIEPLDMDKLDLHVPASTFVDHHDPRVSRFIAMFRERFHTDPDDYAFLGFDVAMFYITALMNEGTRFSERFDRVHTQPLQMSFRMTRAGQENGFRNESGVVLEVKDLELRKAP